MDVFSRYLFTAPLVKIDTQSITRALLNIMTTRSYIPTKKLSDKGSVFVSAKFEQKATDLKIESDHATVIHIYTIRALDLCHSSLESFLSIQTGRHFSNWHRKLSFFPYPYNTTYHTAIHWNDTNPDLPWQPTKKTPWCPILRKTATQSVEIVRFART